MKVLELIDRFALYFASLSLEVRVAVLVAVGLALTFLAVPRFQERFLTALLFMGLAVVSFWMAVAAFM